MARMYIFIDEAGAFQRPTPPNVVSCVAALVVPESLARRLFRRFRKLTRPWRDGGCEVKGSRLDEVQLSEIVAAIRRYDVLLLVVAIDMSLHSERGVSRHKEEQARKIIAGIGPDASRSVEQRLRGLSRRIEALPNQLYVQSVLLTVLAETVLRYATLYYSQRIPKTLGSLCWRVDGKDKKPTSYEVLWQDLVGPFLQTRSVNAPLLHCQGADYSFFDRYAGTLAEAPEHLRSRLQERDGPFHYVDIDAALADLRFCRSERFSGIQMVDILASIVRRTVTSRRVPS